MPCLRPPPRVAQGTEVRARERIPADLCGSAANRAATWQPENPGKRRICGLSGDGGPRNRTWRCGFGDHRVTDTPVPQAAGILGAAGASSQVEGRTERLRPSIGDRNSAVCATNPALPGRLRVAPRAQAAAQACRDRPSSGSLPPCPTSSPSLGPPADPGSDERPWGHREPAAPEACGAPQRTRRMVSCSSR